MVLAVFNCFSVPYLIAYDPEVILVGVLIYSRARSCYIS